MEQTSMWTVIHVSLAAAWLVALAAAFLATRAIKNAGLTFAARERQVLRSRRLQYLPRLCFALTLPIGAELVANLNVYPLNPALRTASWIVAAAWMALLAAIAVNDGKPLAKYLSYAEDGFEVFAGMAFVVYGLNSLAVGAPIDDTRFAAKLFLVGVAFWTLIAIDLNFRAQAWPFEDIAQEGSTPEREEAMSRAVNFTLGAMAVFAALLVAIGILGQPGLF